MVKRRGMAIGIDVGGTFIKAGVVTAEGEIRAMARQETAPSSGVTGVLSNMVRAVQRALQEVSISASDLDGVGVGIPGLCDVSQGIVIQAVNLHWSDVPVAALLQREIGLPVWVDNDANCAALGEQWCGAAMGRRHVVLLTLGTGVGGGLILNGQIYHGGSGWAGEAGHMPVVEGGLPCNCGRLGCLETVASASAMVASAVMAAAQGRAPRMAEMAQKNQGNIDAHLIVTAAREGDEPALEILRLAGSHLGTAVASMVSLLNPELVVVGGGVSRAGDLLLEPVRAVVRERAMPEPAASVQIVPAQLGNEAGMVGAASLVWR